MNVFLSIYKCTIFSLFEYSPSSDANFNYFFTCFFNLSCYYLKGRSSLHNWCFRRAKQIKGKEMTAYKLKSDNIFLRCFDKVAIEVYKLDSPYAFPKTGKSWGNLGIRIGPGNKYKALKIRDTEVNDSELQKLIKELFNSRVIVNREGLCFQATVGVTAAALEVEYYRMFDLFDWAKYQVHASLITRWDRKDFMDGRHLDIVKPNNNLGDGVDGNEYEEKLSKLEKKVRKLEKRVTKLEKGEEVECNIHEDLKKKDDEIRKLKEKIEEVERKKQEDLKMKNDDIEKLKEEVEEVGIKIQEELEKNHDEIGKLKEEIEELRRRKQEDLKKKKYEIEKLKEGIIKEVDLKNQEESKKKDDDIAKLKEEIEEVERKKQEHLKKKDDDIAKLNEESKKKDDEIDKLKEELTKESKNQEELKTKDDEIEKLKEKLSEERKKQEDTNKKQNELNELQRKHKEEMEEAELKKQKELKKKDDEIEKLKEELTKERKKQEDTNEKQDEINELKRKHKEELSVLEKEKEEELRKKKAEFDDLDNELKIYSIERSGFHSDVHNFYRKMMLHLMTPVIKSKFVFAKVSYHNSEKWPPTDNPIPKIYVPLASSNMSRIREIEISHADPNIPADFDMNNWRLLIVAKTSDDRWSMLFKPGDRCIAYYNGKKYQTEAYVRSPNNKYREVIPTPCSDEHMRKGNFLYDVAYILGVGVRICLEKSVIHNSFTG